MHEGEEKCSVCGGWYGPDNFEDGLRCKHCAEKSECPACGGDGWYIDHEDECYRTGDCNCTGIQVECECGA